MAGIFDSGIFDSGIFDEDSGSTSASAGAATGAGSSLGATTSIASSSSGGSGSGAAGGPSGSVSASPGASTGSGSSGGVSGGVATSSGAGSGSGSAYDATITLSASTSASAELASAAGSSGGPTASVAGSASVGSGTGTSGGPSSSASASSGSSSGAGSAYGPSISFGISAHPGVASGTGSSSQARASVASTSGSAGGGGAVYLPELSTWNWSDILSPLDHGGFDGSSATYHGAAKVVHVLEDFFTATPVGTGSSPVYKGQTTQIFATAKSPDQFQTETYTGPILDQPVYRGRSQAIHVFGPDPLTRTPPPPVPSCRCCAEGDCGFTDDFTRSTTTPSLGVATCGLPYRVTGSGSVTIHANGSACLIGLGASGNPNVQATLVAPKPLWDPLARHSINFSLDNFGDPAIDFAERIEFVLRPFGGVTNGPRVVIIPSDTSLWIQDTGPHPASSAYSQITWTSDFVSGTQIPISFWQTTSVYTFSITTSPDGTTMIATISDGSSEYASTGGPVPDNIAFLQFTAQRQKVSPYTTAVVTTITVDNLRVPEVTACSVANYDDFERTEASGWGTATPDGTAYVESGSGTATTSVVPSTAFDLGYGKASLNAFVQRTEEYPAPGPWNNDAGFTHTFWFRDANGGSTFNFYSLDDNIEVLFRTGPTGYVDIATQSFLNEDFVPRTDMAAATWYICELQYKVGDVARVRIWKVGTPVPSTWDAQVSVGVLPVVGSTYIALRNGSSANDMRIAQVSFDGSTSRGDCAESPCVSDPTPASVTRYYLRDLLATSVNYLYEQLVVGPSDTGPTSAGVDEWWWDYGASPPITGLAGGAANAYKPRDGDEILAAVYENDEDTSVGSPRINGLNLQTLFFKIPITSNTYQVTFHTDLLLNLAGPFGEAGLDIVGRGPLDGLHFRSGHWTGTPGSPDSFGTVVSSTHVLTDDSIVSVATFPSSTPTEASLPFNPADDFTGLWAWWDSPMPFKDIADADWGNAEYVAAAAATGHGATSAISGLHVFPVLDSDRSGSGHRFDGSHFLEWDGFYVDVYDNASSGDPHACCAECEDPDNPGFQLPDFTPGYLPIFRRQIGDPTTSLDSFICTLESAAMVLDWHTRGAIQVWGGELIPYCGKTTAEILGHGTSLRNAQLAWAHYDQYLDIRSGQTWDDLMSALSEGRAIILQGDYGEFSLSVRCQDNFVDNHAISVYPYQVSNRLLVGDPICHDFHGIPISELQDYAEALGAATFGVTSPQKILFAVSRPWAP